MVSEMKGLGISKFSHGCSSLPERCNTYCRRSCVGLKAGRRKRGRVTGAVFFFEVSIFPGARLRSQHRTVTEHVRIFSHPGSNQYFSLSPFFFFLNSVKLISNLPFMALKCLISPILPNNSPPRHQITITIPVSHSSKALILTPT